MHMENRVKQDVRRMLLEVARGDRPAMQLLRDARLLNVLTREVERVNIAILGDRIAAVTPLDAPHPDATTIIDLYGRHVTPGFMDPHVHVEGSLTTPAGFAAAVIPHGVTLVAQDPHEVANTAGHAGVVAMADAGLAARLRFLLRVPGRVPGYDQAVESTSGAIDPAQTLALLARPDAVCLAGDYNPRWVLGGEAAMLARIGRAADLGLTVSGQPAGLTGLALNAVIAAGLEDSHVASSVDEIIENMRRGLRTTLVLREGRRIGRRQIGELARRIRDQALETRFIQLSTDEVFPHHLEDIGHMDHRIRLCIEEGIPVAVAYQWATLNVAEGLRIDRDFGSIAPGKYADLLLLDDLERVIVHDTMIGGAFYSTMPAAVPVPAGALMPTLSDRGAVRLRRPLAEDDFALPAPAGAAEVAARVMITEAPKRQDIRTLAVTDGIVEPGPGESHLAMVECRGGSGRIGRAFVAGLNLARGAIASTMCHDAHNMIVVGRSRADMAVAANALAAMGGGYVAVLDAGILSACPLPILGLMTDAPVTQTAAQMRDFEAILTGALGCPAASEILMRLSTLSMANAASCGFSDAGLIDAVTMQPVPTLVEAS